MLHGARSESRSVSQCLHFYLHHKQCFLQEVVFFKMDMAQDATADILKLHSIPAAVSKNLVAILSEEQPHNSSHLTEDPAN